MSYTDRIYVRYIYTKGTTADHWELLQGKISARENRGFTDRGELKTEATFYSLDIYDAYYPDDDRKILSLSQSVDNIMGGTGSKKFEDFIDIVGWIYEETEPQYVYGMHMVQEGEIGEWHDELNQPVTAESLADNRITQPTWLMLFSPVMVKEYGRKWLHDLPVDRIEEFDDGAIMTISVDDFSDHEMALDIYESMADRTDQLTEAFTDYEM